jgi:hypothetical protein
MQILRPPSHWLLAWPVWLSPWDWTTTDWAGVTCAVLVAAALVALRQVREARRLREAQAQPFVVVDFEVDTHDQAIHIVISNIGGTMARDVKLKFEPELTSSLDSHGGNVVPPRDLKPFRDGIPSLPPGKRIPIMIDMFTQRDADKYPDVYTVEISFYAPALRRDLRDDSVLDLGIYRNVLHATRRDIHDIHTQLEKLVKEVRKWTASSGGIKTVTPDDQKRYLRELEASFQEEDEPPSSGNSGGDS